MPCMPVLCLVVGSGFVVILLHIPPLHDWSRERYKGIVIPDAYERLILDCIRCGRERVIGDDRFLWRNLTGSYPQDMSSFQTREVAACVCRILTSSPTSGPLFCLMRCVGSF